MAPGFHMEACPSVCASDWMPSLQMSVGEMAMVISRRSVVSKVEKKACRPCSGIYL